MNTPLNFAFNDRQMRVVVLNDEPWWVAADLCGILSIRNTAQAVGRVDDDLKGICQIDTLGGAQMMAIVAEPGMWLLVLRSDKPEAVELRRWLTRDVLPTLRRTGRYEMPGFEPPPVQALDLDPTRLSVGVSVVRTAMRLYGPAAARSLWVQVGLPPVGSEAAMDGDPLAIPLQAYLQGRMATTIAEAAEGMGLRDPDWSTRLRIGKLLTLWGWSAKNEKVTKYRTARVFRRPPSGVTIEQGIDQ